MVRVAVEVEAGAVAVAVVAVAAAARRTCTDADASDPSIANEIAYCSASTRSSKATTTLSGSSPSSIEYTASSSVSASKTSTHAWLRRWRWMRRGGGGGGGGRCGGGEVAVAVAAHSPQLLELALEPLLLLHLEDARRERRHRVGLERRHLDVALRLADRPVERGVEGLGLLLGEGRRGREAALPREPTRWGGGGGGLTSGASAAHSRTAARRGGVGLRPARWSETGRGWRSVPATTCGGARAAVSLQSGRAVETRRRHSHLQPSRAVWQGQERDQKAGPAGGSAAHGVPIRCEAR